MVDSVMTETAATAVRLSPLGTSAHFSVSGLVIEELPDRAMVQLFARKGSEEAVAATLGISTTPSTATVLDEFTALPLAPGQWMLTSDSGAEGSFCQRIRERLDEASESAHGYVSEQSQGRVIIRVSGDNARELMQKGCRLDLHNRVAGKGFCAQTPIAQVGVLLHQIDDNPAYDLHIYSGFAMSFWQWLTHSASQYGNSAT